MRKPTTFAFQLFDGTGDLDDRDDALHSTHPENDAHPHENLEEPEREPEPDHSDERSSDHQITAGDPDAVAESTVCEVRIVGTKRVKTGWKVHTEYILQITMSDSVVIKCSKRFSTFRYERMSLRTV